MHSILKDEINWRVPLVNGSVPQVLAKLNNMDETLITWLDISQHITINNALSESEANISIDIESLSEIERFIEMPQPFIVQIECMNAYSPPFKVENDEFHSCDCSESYLSSLSDNIPRTLRILGFWMRSKRQRSNLQKYEDDIEYHIDHQNERIIYLISAQSKVEHLKYFIQLSGINEEDHEWKPQINPIEPDEFIKNEENEHQIIIIFKVQTLEAIKTADVGSGGLQRSSYNIQIGFDDDGSGEIVLWSEPVAIHRDIYRGEGSDFYDASLKKLNDFIEMSENEWTDSDSSSV